MSKQTITLGKKLFEFSSKNDWIKGASSIWRRHEVTADNSICVDQLGRICTMGLHFAEAERDNAYPIEVFMTRPETTPQAQPAREPLTSAEIRKWWASENGLEDCCMAKLDDFEKVVRAVEGKHGITKGNT